MSFRLKEASTFLNSIPTKSGTFICYPPSAFDVFGTSYVICDKHPDKQIPVDFNFITLEHDVLTIQQKAVEALKNCSGCREAEAWEKTRFPEGAEL